MKMDTWHPLLQRQLERAGVDPRAADPAWQALLERVSRAYAEHDQERAHQRSAALPPDEARLASLLSLSADWTWEQDAQQRLTFVSDGIEAATGVAAAQWLGHGWLDGGAVEAAPEAVAAHLEALEHRQSFRDFTCGIVRPDGERRYVRLSGEPLSDDAGRFIGYRGVGRDVTEATLSAMKAQELARYDGLTGLPNRQLLLGELERAIARTRRHGSGFALCFIDLDRFKVINDTLGHGAGDELLRLMAGRLRAALRETDLVARFGGDEFVVLLEGPGELGAATLRAIAGKLLAAICEPVTVHGCSFVVTGSIGISVYPDDGRDASTLLQHADTAMYLAKERGKNQLQFYTAELAARAARQFALESDLRLALQRGEFELHFQPKIEIASGRLHSLEALLRWQHPQHGLLLPDTFLPLAEERGLIVPIGRWVLRQACRQMRDWRAAGLEVPPVAVNLSVRQFAADGLLDDIFDALVQHGLAPADLEIELTESVLMADPERAGQLLERLHAMGVGIAIDDFGTGYSSLSYLKRFPARTVKIDRSFIRGLPGSGEDAAITQAVIAMAHSLGLGVVAEGVETEAQLATLRELGCDEAQGFLLGRPMPALDLAARLTPRPRALGRAA